MSLRALAGGLALSGALALCAQSNIVQPGPPGEPARVISPEAARIPARPPTAADVEFMQAMIVHHSQAVDMVQILLKRGANKDLQAFGRRISLSQADEIEGMRQWLRDHHASTEFNAQAHHHHSPGMDMSKMKAGDMPIMGGMLSPNQMKALAKSSGKQTDYLFLTGMIQHHQGALDMVDDLLAAGGAERDSRLFDFVTDIDNGQSAEIKIMKNMLAQMNIPASQKKASPKDKK